MNYEIYGAGGRIRLEYQGNLVLDIPVSLGTRLLEPVELLNKVVETGIIKPDERELADMKRDLVALVRTMNQKASDRLVRMVFDEGDER